MTGADHVPDDWAPVQVKPLWATRLQDIARGLEENQVPILSGSVTTLANRVDGIESLIATMQTNLANNPANQDVTELRGNFSKLSNELAEIKAVDLTKIRQATETITGNSAFFVEAIATQGKIEALRAIVDALNLRVKDLEEQRERKRSQREWLINAAIAVLGIVIGAAGALLTK